MRCKYRSINFLPHGVYLGALGVTGLAFSCNAIDSDSTLPGGSLRQNDFGDAQGENVHDVRTFVLRNCPALAAREIHLHSIVIGCKKEKMFVDARGAANESVTAAVTAALNADKESKPPILASTERLDSIGIGAMLDKMATRYAKLKTCSPQKFKTANFALPEEVRAVSHPLWTRKVLECGSQERRTN